MNRPRGLCWHCYYTPGIKDQYQPISPRGNHPDDSDPPCWGCGTPAPNGRGDNVAHGWVGRWIVMGWGKPVRELYCRECFALHGWPVPIEQRYYHVPTESGRRVAETVRLVPNPGLVSTESQRDPGGALVEVAPTQKIADQLARSLRPRGRRTTYRHRIPTGPKGVPDRDGVV